MIEWQKRVRRSRRRRLQCFDKSTYGRDDMRLARCDHNNLNGIRSLGRAALAGQRNYARAYNVWMAMIFLCIDMLGGICVRVSWSWCGLSSRPAHTRSSIICRRILYVYMFRIVYSVCICVHLDVRAFSQDDTNWTWPLVCLTNERESSPKCVTAAVDASTLSTERCARRTSGVYMHMRCAAASRVGQRENRHRETSTQPIGPWPARNGLDLRDLLDSPVSLSSLLG